MENLQSTAKLLDAIRQVQSNFILEPDTKVAFKSLLDDLLSLTDSEYGFIGEVEHAEGDRRQLRVWAYTDISWNDATRKLLKDSATTGLVFSNLDTLFGHAIRHDVPVISNNPKRDPRAGGLPPGHPAMDSFLGLPFRFRNEQIGLVGLANRPGGYSEQVVEFLEPLLSACGVLAHAAKMEEEQRKNREFMENARRNEKLMEFSQRLAHDLNNLLTVIACSADSHRAMMGDLADCAEVDLIIQATQRASELSKRILSYAGSASSNLHATSIGKIIEEAREFFGAVAPPNVEISLVVDVDLPLVRADHTVLHQAIVNVLFNSLESLGDDGGWIRISAKKSDDDSIRVVVEDNGQGMDEETRRKAVEPYFSTKGDNRGFGLSSVVGVMSSHGGTLEIESTPGAGTSVAFTLPAYQQDPEPVRCLGEDKFTQLRFLVIDDDDQVRNALGAWLESRKSTVTKVVSGFEALEQIGSDANFDVILLDISMPRMDGLETCTRLREHCSTPVVLMSGKTDHTIPDSIAMDPNTTFIRKPFSLEELSRALEIVGA